ncbi:hypothetical protein C2S51_036173 [Perilla frutescens var. frutescens]|nr:hypothetical protein C2S51_036173 [Perilla frutescens var. frutescens]
MNMDEFLNNMLTTEENEAQASNGTNVMQQQFPLQESCNSNGKRLLAKQPSLSRQGSLSIPEPLCRKTVDQVWSEIHKDQQHHHHLHTTSARKQTTFGEITLEDFLSQSQPLPPTVANGERGTGGSFGMGSPVSLLSNGMDARGGRKQMLDDPVEKVVERRQ